MTAEAARLAEAREHTAHWKRWGPDVMERQWGAVRTGTKAALQHRVPLSPGEARVIKRRLANSPPVGNRLGGEFDALFGRRREADAFCDFHGAMGAGLGASRQTGWTGLEAKLMER